MLIIHGDDQVASRQFLLETKQAEVIKGLEIIQLDGDNLTLSDLYQYVDTKNLLGETNCIAIEGFFSRRPSAEKKKITEQLVKWSTENLIFWDGKDIGVQQKEFDSKIIKKFDSPKHIWKFLDTLALSDLELALENTAPEFVFTMLVGQVRKLITKGAGLPGWQAGKIKQMAKNYTDEQLLMMHRALLDIDYRQKTSAASYDLRIALELWVIKANNKQ
jgi:hypothetical protein